MKMISKPTENDKRLHKKLAIAACLRVRFWKSNEYKTVSATNAKSSANARYHKYVKPIKGKTNQTSGCVAIFAIRQLRKIKGMEYFFLSKINRINNSRKKVRKNAWTNVRFICSSSVVCPSQSIEG